MSSASNPSVLPLDRGLKKTKTTGDNITKKDMDNLQQEIKADVEVFFEEFNSIQKSLSDRLESFETAYTEENKKNTKLFADMDKEFKNFNKQLKESVNFPTKSETQSFEKNHNELAGRIDQMEKLVSNLNLSTSNDTAQDLRNELVEGIKLIGKRVSKAIGDMDERFQKVSERIDNVSNFEQLESGETNFSPNNSEEIVTTEPEFGSIKENDLLTDENYEVVAKNSISKLTILFKKQSQAVKKFISEQQVKSESFNHTLKNYDIEIAKLMELLEIKTKNNFRFTIIGFSVLTVFMVISRFI